MTQVGLTGALVGGKYRVLRRLGQGPRGALYLCNDAEDGSPVALKLPHPQLMASEEFRSQFWLELVAAGRLRSPSVVPLLTFGEDLELASYYAAMPYVAQPDLATVLRENGALSPSLSAQLIAQVLEAIAAAHAAGIVHLNLKPTNVFVQLEIDAPPRVRISDFGFSHLADQFGRFGTVEYAAPEQASGLVVEPRSDIYAAGVMLYEMLAGRLPFEAPTALEVARMHRGLPPPPPSGFRHMPPALESVCLKALSKTPDARYQSAVEMREALGALPELAVRPPRARPPRKHDSLAPAERTARDDAEDSIPKRRSGLVLVAAACLACASWASFADVAQLIRRGSQDLPTAHRAPSVLRPRLDLVIAGEPQGAQPEPAQLVATQNAAALQPQAAGRVTLSAVWPRSAATEQLGKALDVPAIHACYAASLSQPGALREPLTARLDLETAVDGRVRWSKLRAPRLAPATRKCIERAALSAAVPSVHGVNVAASAQLDFDPR
ncbi:MAG TPA: serine/threonine-protein kinase [Polyangiales bacterium]|nr:serine/threonine-protein kinase [Polyangiales bacterium]